MRIHILTLFPELFTAFLEASIIGRAVKSGLVEFSLTQLRDFSEDKHRSVDDKPFGGGGGMVLMCGPVFRAVEHIQAQADAELARVMLTPQGERMTRKTARELADLKHLLLICGHYEGFDERIRVGLGARELSVGDFVLSGGESAAMVVIDAVVRLLPGALGAEEAASQDSFEDGLLEYPHYTRPRNFRGMEVPEVLLSGDHARIAAWKREQALLRTRQRRPDLLPDDAREIGDGTQVD